MTHNVKFQTESYDPFIDFLKGICIILVVLTHCIPSQWEVGTLFRLWGRTAIPIFFIIQVFHVYKNGFNYRMPNIKKIWNRILRPFISLQILIAALLLIVARYYPPYQQIDLQQYIKHILLMGGYGPGEYYPWVYVQFAFIVPMIAPIFKKMKPLPLLLLFVCVSQLFEVIACFYNIPDWPYYSLCFSRYTFLIYLGYILATRGFTVNKWTITISLISLIATYYLSYTSYNFEPFFFARTQWRYCHWICYFYIAYLCIPLLKFIFDHIKKYDRITNLIKLIGKNSYEIYLFQMLFFVAMYKYTTMIVHYLFSSHGSILCVIASVLICVFTPLAFKYLTMRIIH